jgi:hypothetical protein
MFLQSDVFFFHFFSAEGTKQNACAANAARVIYINYDEEDQMVSIFIFTM